METETEVATVVELPPPARQDGGGEQATSRKLRAL